MSDLQTASGGGGAAAGRRASLARPPNPFPTLTPLKDVVLSALVLRFLLGDTGARAAAGTGANAIALDPGAMTLPCMRRAGPIELDLIPGRRLKKGKMACECPLWVCAALWRTIHPP